MDLTVDSTVGSTAGCWDEAMACSGVGSRAGWMTARMAVKKAGWVAVCLIGLTVGQLAGCWAEVMVETRVG